MALIDTCRNNITRKREELAKLSSDKAKESLKFSKENQKILSAKSAISRTKSLSTIKSRQNDIERAEKQIASINKKIADIDKNIAKKDKELASEEKKFRAEEAKLLKKQSDIEKRRLQEQEKQMQKVNNTLLQHSFEQELLKNDVKILKQKPTKIVVLFLASNPNGTGQLKLDQEARNIQEMIRKSEHRDSVSLETRWAVRPLDILQAINEVNPTIIHFSGHGAEDGSLVLQNPDGSPKLVSKEAITQTVITASDEIKLILFNACFSSEQAQHVTEYIDAAIGMNTAIGDEAACVFAAQFYSAIGFALSVKKAYEQALAALMLEGISEETTPELYIKSDKDADEMILIRVE